MRAWPRCAPTDFLGSRRNDSRRTRPPFRLVGRLRRWAPPPARCSRVRSAQGSAERPRVTAVLDPRDGRRTRVGDPVLTGPRIVRQKDRSPLTPCQGSRIRHVCRQTIRLSQSSHRIRAPSAGMSGCSDHRRAAPRPVRYPGAGFRRQRHPNHPRPKLAATGTRVAGRRPSSSAPMIRPAALCSSAPPAHSSDARGAPRCHFRVSSSVDPSRRSGG